MNTRNLSEVVVRASDTFESLSKKIRIATFIGTLQATLTDFKYLNPEWKKNTEEEALLGVSLTGIMDNAFMSGDTEEALYNWGDPLEYVLTELRNIAIETNKDWAQKLGINQSAAITCVN